MDISKLGVNSYYSPINKMVTKRENILGNDATLQSKYVGNKIGIEINISKEGRELQLSEQSQLSVDNSILGGLDINKIKAAINGSENEWKNITEFTDPSLVVPKNSGLLILPYDSPQEIYRKELINAASLYGSIDNELNSTERLGSVASKYMELRKGIEEKYSDEELSEQLKLLDESYGNAIDTMASHAALGAKVGAKMYELKVRANNELVEFGETHGHTFGIPVSDKVEYDKDAFRKSIDSLTKNITDSIRYYGALAKQYMLDGYETPITEEGKDNFISYLTQNTDSKNGIYSLDDLDTLNTILPAGYSNDKDSLYTALEKLQDSGLSDDIKSALIRMTTQGDRMFNSIPKGYEKREQNLYEQMLKWQKTS